MKNIFLSVVIIGVLVVAGVGGTLADFSDSEEEMGDTIQAGSLDLLVNGENDLNLLPLSIRGMKPEKSYHIQKTIQNMGTIDGYLYIHFKNVECKETNDKDLNGDGSITAPEDNPEPENVAQFGGKHGQAIIDPGLGERCDMEEHVRVQILWGPAGAMTPVDLSALDSNNDGKVTLAEVECQQIHITTLDKPLPACGEEYLIRIGFVLHDVPEIFYNLDYFDETNPNELIFDHWPTNCYQGDTVSFDILFALLQTDYTPPGGGS